MWLVYWPNLTFNATTCSSAPCLQAYELRGAGAVLHSHSLNAVMVTLLDEAAPEFSVTHLEMIKVRTKPWQRAEYCQLVHHPSPVQLS